MSSEAILLTHPDDIRLLYDLVYCALDEDSTFCPSDEDSIRRAFELLSELEASVNYLDNPDA